MFAIILNAVAIFIGSALGALFQRGISEKYVNVLNTAMGLCAITLGMNVAIESMQKTQYPVLFIFCLSIGGLIGTLFKMDSAWKTPHEASRDRTLERASPPVCCSAASERLP